MASYRDYISEASVNTTYAISGQPQASQDEAASQQPSYGVFPGNVGHPNDQPSQAEPKPLAFFLFFNCKTTGSSIHRDDIVEMAVQSWPYVQNSPLFQSKVDNTGGRKGRQPTRKKTGRKTTHPDDVQGQPFPVVWKLFMQWLDRILNHAASVIGTQIYPVLVAHHGDTYDFHFLFRAFENHKIDLRDPANLDIHFCDPVPLLQQYKDYAHPWLIESKSMAIGSLLNDWLPGQFDIGDLYFCPGKAWLAAKLYSQTPMYHLLKEFPLYPTDEWIEYYEEVKQYKDDKKSLEDNFPAKIVEVQRKFAVRSLLQWGYNWDGLIELYKSCSSPTHFRQELKDCDLKSGAASQLTWKFVEMDLPQDGTREYKLRIKKNMPPQRYTHLTDRRGRWWMLRVKNELPPCVFSPDDVLPDIPSTSQWKVPENLLLIRYPEAWFPMAGETPDEDDVIDQMHLESLTFNSDDDSGDSWDPIEDEEAALRQSLQPLDELIKEQPEAPPVTSFVFGDESTAFNPFTDRSKQKDLQYELREGDRKKHREGLWASIKTDEKEEPTYFGQAIKFCRPQIPAGAEESLYRSKKIDKDEDRMDKNRKGFKGKNKGKKGNNNDRSFGRSQSWTGDNHEKTNQSKPRTVSCSVPESWEEETSFEPARQTKSEEIVSQEKDSETNSAAAHRMINFHLNQNDNKKSRNRRNRRGRSNNKSESDKDEDNRKQQNQSGNRSVVKIKSVKSTSWGQNEVNLISKLEDQRPRNVDNSKAVNDNRITFGSGNRATGKNNSTAWGQNDHDLTNQSEDNYPRSVDKSKAVYDNKISFGSSNRAMGKGNSVKSTAWGENEPDLKSNSLESHQSNFDKPKPASDISITFGSGNSSTGKNNLMKSSAWGQKESDTKPPPWGPICNGTTETKPQVSSFTFYNSKKGKPSQPILQGKRPTWGKQASDSGVNNIMHNAWPSVSKDSTQHETKKQSGVYGNVNSRNSVNNKFSQKCEDTSSGLRLPKGASKAHTVASKEVKGHSQFGAVHNATQPAADETILGESGKGTSSFDSQRLINSKTNSPSCGFNQSKGGLGQRNTGRNFEQSKDRTASYGQNSRGGNNNWNKPTNNMPSYTPVAIDTNGASEDWEDEVEEYYGY